jgi:hypothetical protein
MSRLLSAAARGARVQRESELLSGGFHWENTGVQWGLDDELRIHPDDEHLQYGPISTALHDLELWELEGDGAPCLALHTLIACGLDSSWVTTWRKQDVGERALAILIIAEALADEGL